VSVVLVPVGLHNTFRNFSGDLASGIVIFKPKIAELAGETTFAPLPIEVDVVDGEMTVTLMAPATSGDEPIVYLVTERLAPLKQGANQPPYQISIPGGASDGAVFELSDRDDTGLLPLPDNSSDTSGVFGDDGTFG
jgi:hypothetical protein